MNPSQSGVARDRWIEIDMAMAVVAGLQPRLAVVGLAA
jgi:hypothetical protein